MEVIASNAATAGRTLLGSCFKFSLFDPRIPGMDLTFSLLAFFDVPVCDFCLRPGISIGLEGRFDVELIMVVNRSEKTLVILELKL